MPIDTQIDKQKRLVTHTVTGEIDLSEILERVSGLFSNEDFESDFRIFCDITQGSIRGLSQEDLLRIAQTTENFKDKRGTGRSAVLVSENLDFGLFRMFEGMLLESDRPIRIFRNAEEAEKWLESDQ